VTTLQALINVGNLFAADAQIPYPGIVQLDAINLAASISCRWENLSGAFGSFKSTAARVLR
jgi:hypothetical protein